MTTEELLKPRVKCISPTNEHYPNSPFTVGDILEQVHPELSSSNPYKGNWEYGKNKEIYHPEKFPHLFKKLEWWEDRKPEDMPEYVRRGELEKIQEHFPETANQIMELQETLFKIGFTWGWNDIPPKGKEYEEVMNKIFPGFSDLKAAKRQKSIDTAFNPICHKCQHGHELNFVRETFIQSNLFNQ